LALREATKLPDDLNSVSVTEKMAKMRTVIRAIDVTTMIRATARRRSLLRGFRGAFIKAK
jgi:hypothetical protein